MKGQGIGTPGNRDLDFHRQQSPVPGHQIPGDPPVLTDRDPVQQGRMFLTVNSKQERPDGKGFGAVVFHHEAEPDRNSGPVNLGRIQIPGEHPQGVGEKILFTGGWFGQDKIGFVISGIMPVGPTGKGHTRGDIRRGPFHHVGVRQRTIAHQIQDGLPADQSHGVRAVLQTQINFRVSDRVAHPVPVDNQESLSGFQLTEWVARPARRPYGSLGSVGELQPDISQRLGLWPGIQQLNKFASAVTALGIGEKFVDDQSRPQGVRMDDQNQAGQGWSKPVVSATGTLEGVRGLMEWIHVGQAIREENLRKQGGSEQAVATPEKPLQAQQHRYQNQERPA